MAVAALLVLITILMNVAMPKFKQMQTLVDRLNLVSREILTGIMPIRAFSREKFEEARFDKANRDLMGTQLFTNRTMAAMMPFMTLIMNGTSLLIVWFGGKAMDLGNMQVGEMIAFITYTMQIVMSFLMLAMVAVMLPRAGVAADRIDEVIKTPATIRDPDNATAKPALERKNWNGEVEFKDVSFRYPGADSDALEHITFTARPGETTAIIGSTGCGKSTLLNLIPALLRRHRRCGLHGRRGRARHVPGRRCATLMGYVPQKGVLFSGHHRQQPDNLPAAISPTRTCVPPPALAQADRVYRCQAGAATQAAIAQGGTQCFRRAEAASFHRARAWPKSRASTCLTTASRRWITRPTRPCAVP